MSLHALHGTQLGTLIVAIIVFVLQRWVIREEVAGVQDNVGMPVGRYLRQGVFQTGGRAGREARGGRQGLQRVQGCAAGAEGGGGALNSPLELSRWPSCTTEGRHGPPNKRMET